MLDEVREPEAGGVVVDAGGDQLGHATPTSEWSQLAAAHRPRRRRSQTPYTSPRPKKIVSFVRSDQRGPNSSPQPGLIAWWSESTGLPEWRGTAGPGSRGVRTDTFRRRCARGRLRACHCCANSNQAKSPTKLLTTFASMFSDTHCFAASSAAWASASEAQALTEMIWPS